VYKEWTCPIRSNTYVFPTICLLLFVHFAADKDGADSLDLAKALFWIAAPLQLLISVRILSQWMYYLRNDDHVSVLWLAVPLCNVFAATAYQVAYPSFSITGSAAQLWMGFAALLFIALYPIALHRAIMGHNQVMEDRSTHWLLAAAPAALAIAWQSLYGATGLTIVFVSLYFGGLVMLACLLYGIYPMRCADSCHPLMCFELAHTDFSASYKSASRGANNTRLFGKFDGGYGWGELKRRV
jgi:Voltage-dependent anion channel